MPLRIQFPKYSNNRFKQIDYYLILIKPEYRDFIKTECLKNIYLNKEEV